MDTTAAVIDALERAPDIVVPLVRCLFFDRLDQMLASPAPVITPYDPGMADADDILKYSSRTYRLVPRMW
jgi:hypothetical protein